MDRRTFLGGLAAASGWGTAATTPPELDFASAADAARAVRTRRISARELTELAFRRIDRYNPRINAVVVQFREKALEDARKADAAVARKEKLGPLHGVPITVKESYNVAGALTTVGIKGLPNSRAAANAVTVDRLLAAGAILLGKTNVPLGLTDWQSYNEVYGVTHNPWDLKRTPGGSTGGGAAALAAGLGHLTMGSDIGGSIRVPAHFCGVYGHKPSIDLIPSRGEMIGPQGQPPAYLPALAVVGPLARSANDLRLALEITAGPDVDDAHAYRWTLPAPRQTRLSQFRVGYVLDDKICPVASDVAAALENALSALGKAGVKLERGWPEGINPEAQLNTYMHLLGAALGAGFDARTIEAFKALGGAEAVFATAASGSYTAFRRAMEQRLAAQAAWRRYFSSHDVFLLPTAFVAAFPHDHSFMPSRRLATGEGPRSYMDMIRWIAPATLTGLPATTAPVGRTTNGLPVGLQILGPYLEDATPIEFAARMAEVVGGFTPPPLS